MKLNKLLPIVALSGIATIPMSFVTSCNKGNTDPVIPPEPEPADAIKLNEYNDFGKGLEALVPKEMKTETFETNHLYTFKASFENVSQFSRTWTGYECDFSLIPDLTDPSMIFPVKKDTLKVWVGTKPLDELEMSAHNGDERFVGWYLYEDSGQEALLVFNDEIMTTEVITVQAEFTEQQNEVLPIALPSGWLSK